MNGNRTSVKVDGVTTQALTFKAGNQIPTAGYGFDTAGQQTTASGAGTLGYNGAGQMTTATKAGAATSYAYAGPGQDELLTVNPIGADRYDVYGRAGDHGVPVIDSVAKNGAVSYRGNDPGGTPLAIHLSGRQADYYVLDGNGSVVALVDGPGTGNGTYSYDPNGAQTRPTGSGTVVDLTPYRPTTGILDHATGLIKHGTRWNDTATGRWTTTDPITRLNDPNNANPYTCAADNPINNTDATGLFDFHAGVNSSLTACLPEWSQAQSPAVLKQLKLVAHRAL